MKRTKWFVDMSQKKHMKNEKMKASLKHNLKYMYKPKNLRWRDISTSKSSLYFSNFHSKTKKDHILLTSTMNAYFSHTIIEVFR